MSFPYQKFTEEAISARTILTTERSWDISPVDLVTCHQKRGSFPRSFMTENDRSGTNEALPFNCLDCRHYYVTWDRSFPHGCKAMGFKCKKSPAVQVREASGMNCQLFLKKEGR